MGPVGRWDPQCEAIPFYRWLIEALGCLITYGAQAVHTCPHVFSASSGAPRVPGKPPGHWGRRKTTWKAVSPCSHLSCAVPRPTPLQLSPGPRHSLSPPPVLLSPSLLLPFPVALLAGAQRRGPCHHCHLCPPPLCLHLPHWGPEGASRDFQNVPCLLTCLCLGLSWAFCLDLPSLFPSLLLKG